MNLARLRTSADFRLRLYVICDAEVCGRAGWGLVDYAAACLAGGARLLQIRAKALAGRDFLEAATAIVARAAAGGATVIVNDRADIARLSGAAGVHVGQDDLAPAQARAVLGPNAIVGLSTHTAEQVDRALRRADRLPRRRTDLRNGHEGDRLRTGRRRGRAARRRSRPPPETLPVVAIGGITLERSRSVLDAGARIGGRDFRSVERRRPRRASPRIS